MSEVAAAQPTGSSEGAQSEAQVQEVVQTETAPQQVVPNKKKFVLKVDGEDVEEEIDLNDEEGMKARLQLARAAKKRMSEAVAEKKKAFEIIKAFEADPESMLARLGPKGREIAEQYLLKQIQDDMLSPQEKEHRDLKKKLETYEQKEAREKQEREQSIQQKKEYEYAQSFQNTIIQALNKSGLPKSPELVKRMAAVMSKNLELGLELTPDDLVSEVKSDLINILKSVVGDADGDSLIQMFGKDVANKIRKSDLRVLQEKQSQLFQSGIRQEKSQKTAPPSKGFQTIEEFMAEAERRIRE
jgi:hypothetical protein